jgi:hypothetical protein
MHELWEHDDHGTVQVMNSKTMRWVYRTVPLLSSLVVAAASFALSFVALRDVAAETQAVPQRLAWLVPIVIDGGVMCASAVIWATAAMRRKRQIFPFVVVFVLVALSVVVNAAHAGPSLLAKAIAALPPLVLLATLELVAITTRSASEDGRGRRQPVRAGTTPLKTDVDASLAALEADFETPVSETPAAGATRGRAPRAATPSLTRRPTRVRATTPEP